MRQGERFTHFPELLKLPWCLIDTSVLPVAKGEIEGVVVGSLVYSLASNRFWVNFAKAPNCSLTHFVQITVSKIDTFTTTSEQPENDILEHNILGMLLVVIRPTSIRWITTSQDVGMC